MKKDYVAPELKTVGRTDEVILGSLGVGEDFRCEFLAPYMEFETDKEVPGVHQ